MQNKVKKKTVALAGNPNVGKSVFFNYLSKTYVDVSNYPGTTIEITSVEISEEVILQDTPGVYGISSVNDEEKVARDILLYADEVINIVSAISLERDLFLTRQLIDMGKKVIVVINQIDEASSIGLEINDKELQGLLGVPVFKTVAITNEGMAEILDAIKSGIAKEGNVDPIVKTKITELIPLVKEKSEALLILEGDLVIAERRKIFPRNEKNEFYSNRRRDVNELVKAIVKKTSQKEDFLSSFSNFLIHPFGGSIVALLVAYLFLYQFLGIFIGGTVVDFTEGKLMNGYYEPTVKELTGKFFPVEVTVHKEGEKNTYTFPRGTNKEPRKYKALKKLEKEDSSISKEFFFSRHDYIEKERISSSLEPSLAASIGTILAGKYGILTLTITYLLGLLLPLVIAFYTALGILEDSGYLPRLAVLMDGALTKFGLNGRAIIPLVLGLGCVTMATVTTKLLKTKREKIIAMAILGFAIPCSAQLGVIQSLLANSGGVKAWLIWLGIIGSVLGVTGLVMNKFLPGNATPLFIDLPPLRVPRLKNVYMKAKSKITFFMTEAVPAFFIAAGIVAIMQVNGLLTKTINLFQPICENLLLLPKDVSVSFILGMVRRDFGAFGLTELDLSTSQVITSSVVLTLFVPCIATLAIMAKEQSWKIASGIWLSSIIISLSIGSIVARLF